YENYHFDEEIKEDDVLFNYLIKPGKATSRNAIRLLSLMGFPENIIDKANNMAKDFTENGVWG
ncbi:MAG: DNA mismatch repair protein MutS, partial [Lachnospiraceae bacterium]|nr:DNA mismatch repair protein MutS [Lachnospiraceae bacterium]